MAAAGPVGAGIAATIGLGLRGDGFMQDHFGFGVGDMVDGGADMGGDFAQWLDNHGKAGKEIAYRPARVLMQDFTGVPAVVDLAAMRDATAKLGGKTSAINPQEMSPRARAAPTHPGARWPNWLIALKRCVTHLAPASKHACASAKSQSE